MALGMGPCYVERMVHQGICESVIEYFLILPENFLEPSNRATALAVVVGGNDC